MLVAIIPDVHIPYHDHAAWSRALQMIKASGASKVVIIGDFVDCYSVSTFTKDPSRIQAIADEIKMANRELDRLSNVCDRVVYLEGNHEARLPKYVATNAPGLWGLASMKEALGIKRRGWEWQDYKTIYRIGKVAYSHDFGRHGIYALHQSLSAFGGNIVFGHTHRAGIHYGGNLADGNQVAMSVGWLGDVESVDYMHREIARKDWQHGVGFVEYARSGLVEMSFRPIITTR